MDAITKTVLIVGIDDGGRVIRAKSFEGSSDKVESYTLAPRLRLSIGLGIPFIRCGDRAFVPRIFDEDTPEDFKEIVREGGCTIECHKALHSCTSTRMFAYLKISAYDEIFYLISGMEEERFESLDLCLKTASVFWPELRKGAPVTGA